MRRNADFLFTKYVSTGARLMRILRAADHRVMPWKNGGGVTTEIAVHPDGAGLDAFEWRLSMATVASDGPFSLFAGVDRTLAVLEGVGIVLAVDGLPEQTLTSMTGPFPFPADRPAAARLLAGPIVDLNVMTRRGVCKQRVEGPLDGWEGTPRKDGFTIVFCAAGSVTIASGAARQELAAHDAAILDTATFCEIAAGEGSAFHVVMLDRLRDMSAA